MTVKKSDNRDVYVTVYRRDEDVEVKVEQLETLLIHSHKEDRFEVVLSGCDQDTSQTDVRLYIPVKTMEFLCREFQEYKEQAKEEHRGKDSKDREI